MAALAFLALVPGARAQSVYGTAQLQYQHADQVQTFLVGDSLFSTRRTRTDFWLRSIDFHHQTFLSRDLLMDSNLKLTDQSYISQNSLARTPFGSVRLVHPVFQLLGSVQPASVRASLTSLSGLSPDSATRVRVTSHLTESRLNGHFGLPGWPQVDGAWSTTKRDGGGSQNDRNTSRTLRATLDRERYSVYGGLNDQVSTSSATGSVQSSQQLWNGGGTLHLAPGKTTSVTAQYDASDVRSHVAGRLRPSTLSQSASLNGAWRPGRKVSSSLSYVWHFIDQGTVATPPQSDHEATALLKLAATRSLGLTSGAGLRTVRQTLPDRSTQRALERYVTGVASLDRRIRRTWVLNAAASHSTNWEPGLASYSVESFGATTRGSLTRRILVDGGWQLSSNGDTAIAAQRRSNAWNVRVQNTVLRTLLVTVTYRNQRVGPGFLRPTSVSRGEVVDVAWRVAPNFQVIGNVAHSSLLPGAANANTSHSVNVKWDATRSWQWYGSWTRTGQQAITSTAGQLSSRETVTGRIQYAPSRRVAAQATLLVSEPGKTRQSQQYDLNLTWSFGR